MHFPTGTGRYVQYRTDTDPDRLNFSFALRYQVLFGIQSDWSDIIPEDISTGTTGQHWHDWNRPVKAEMWAVTRREPAKDDVECSSDLCHFIGIPSGDVNAITFARLLSHDYFRLWNDRVEQRITAQADS